MLATSLLSLVLLGLAGILLDSHRREWVHASEAPSGSGEGGSGEYAFARSRYRRRLIATVTIAAVGILIALWPVVPREPLWVLGFATVLAAMAMQIFVLGVGDAWASNRFFKRMSRQQASEHTAKLREALRDAGSVPEPSSSDSEAIRA